VTVLVTGAGGPAGVAVIRALRNHRRVVAVDADPFAVGLRLADDGAVIPACDDDGFVDELARVAERTGARVLISTLAEEMRMLHTHGDRLSLHDTRTWIADRAALDQCLDKWCFAQALSEAGVPTPYTALGGVANVPGPWIVKPRWGRGSRHVYAADDRDDLERMLARVPNPIVQHRLDGTEFTVDVLIDRDGTVAGAVPRWRLETKAGISTKGMTFVDDDLLAIVDRAVQAVRLTGAANLQGFTSPDGEHTITEINPRFSGGLPLSLAAGADLVGEYVRGVEGRPLRQERLRFRAGVVMLRHFDEVFEE